MARRSVGLWVVCAAWLGAAAPCLGTELVPERLSRAEVRRRLLERLSRLRCHDARGWRALGERVRRVGGQAMVLDAVRTAPDPRARAGAARAVRILGLAARPDAMWALLSGLEDPAPRVRRAASESLQAWAEERPPGDAEVAEALRVLDELLDRPRWGVRAAAARALRGFGAAGAERLRRHLAATVRALLAEGLRDPDPAERGRARVALARLLDHPQAATLDPRPIAAALARSLAWFGDAPRLGDRTAGDRSAGAATWALAHTGEWLRRRGVTAWWVVVAARWRDGAATLAWLTAGFAALAWVMRRLPVGRPVRLAVGLVATALAATTAARTLLLPLREPWVQRFVYLLWFEPAPGAAPARLPVTLAVCATSACAAAALWAVAPRGASEGAGSS